MDDVIIEKNAKVHYSIVDAETVIMENACVGKESASKKNITVIKKGSRIKADQAIND